MLQTSRSYVVISLLICISLAGCKINLPATPVAAQPRPPATATIPPSSSPTPESAQEWFGMQVPSGQWQTEEIKDSLYQHGSLTHRSLAGCRVWILSDDPAYINGYKSDEQASTLEQFQTAETRIDLRRIRDQEGTLRDTYFEVFDTTGRSGFKELRLAYFLVEAEGKPIHCLEAAYSLLLTLKPERFPVIPVGQG